MKPITDTCVPREDVLAGTMRDDQFAAQLWNVVTAPDDYEVYGDADAFFELTFPTNGLTKLLEMTFGRLAGDPTRGSSGVIRSETSFGGGKTHGLIALHHLANGARPKDIDEFVDPTLLPDGCRSIALVGEVIDPVAGAKAPDGTAVRTLWGEMAVQLGDDAWDALRQNDRERSAPGRDTLRAALGNEATVVMIDEIAHYVARCARSGNEDVRRLATTTADFLKTLFELAMSSPNIVVIFTLASVNDAFAKETEQVQQLVDEVMGEVRSVAGRQTASVTPATDVEVASIVRRRLFASIDEDAARATADEYAALYDTCAKRDLHLAGATENPQTYADTMVAAYPFHPELLRVLDEKLSTIPQFQRTRSALRLLAQTVRVLWSDAVDDALQQAAGIKEQAPAVINVADIPLHDDDVLSMLTKRLERDAFEQVARADITGTDGHAVLIAGKRKDDKPVRVCVATFLHSLEFSRVAGATRGDRTLGALRPGDDPDALDDALDAVAEVAWHLENDTIRARFSPEPNVNKIIAEEARSLPTSKVLDYTEDLVHDLFRKPTRADAKQALVCDVFPSGGLTGVADEQKFHLVVVPPGDLTVTDATATPVPDLLQTAAAKHGEQSRKNRNAIGFVVADEHRVTALHNAVRERMAAESLASSEERLAQLGSDKARDKVRDKAGEKALTSRIAVASCFAHIYWPTKDQHNGNLRHGELPPASKGDVQGPSSDRVWDLFDAEGKVHDGPLSTQYVKSKCWNTSTRDTIPSTELEQHFWRDPSARLLTNTSALVTVIRQGAESGDWVWFHQTSQAYKQLDKGTAVVALDPDGLLCTPDWASQQGFLYEPPTGDEVEALVPEDDDEHLSANEVRDQLEQQRDDTIDKDDLAGVITTLVRQNRITVHLDEPDGDTVNPSDIGKYALGRLCLKRSDDRSQVRAFRVFKGEGNVGQAFTHALAQAEDRIRENTDATGIDQITVQLDATAEASRVKSAKLLPNMEQKLPLTVTVELTGTLPDDTGSVVIDATFDKATVKKVGDLIDKALATAEDLDGSIAITCTFATPVVPDDGDVDKLRNTLATLFQGVPVRVDGKVR